MSEIIFETNAFYECYTPFNSQDSQMDELENSINERQENEEKLEFDVFYETLLVGIDRNSKYYQKNIRDIVEQAENRLRKFLKQFEISEIHDVEFKADTIVTRCCVCMRDTTCKSRIITKSGEEYDVFTAGSGCASVVNYYIWITRELPVIARGTIGKENEQTAKVEHRKALEEALHQLRIALTH